MKQDIKHKILEAGARIMHLKGYHHTGIQEVLEAAGVPKGSFYFYFKSKEDFGLQAIDFFNSMYMGMVGPIARNKSLPPLTRIEKIFDYFIDLFPGLNYTCGCPIGNLSQEMGDLSQSFSSKLAASVEFMAEVYKNLLDEAKETNEISKEMNTQAAAEFIVASWHGSLMKMKISKSVAPLQLHKQFIRDILQR